MRSNQSKRSVITHINPKSPISEAYRSLRTNIQFSGIDKELNVIMITSAGPGEGKSTTASNLAVTYAQADKKVLLIDADLRKPTVHHIFTTSNRFGLTNVLAGQCEISEVINSTFADNLYLLTAGTLPPNPSEILASNAMQELIQELRKLFDVIIVDTPPTLVVTDAQIISTWCDGVLLVIDSGRVKRDMAQKVKENLVHANAKILGVVLNNVDRKSGETYYYYYYGSDK